jgi:glucose 1-dehydrogenase
MSLANKVAFVSGASRGIGKAVAIALAKDGADVAINFHSHAQEAKEVARLVEGAGRRVLLCRGDVADDVAVEKMIRDVVQTLGKIDFAVANAAFSYRGAFHELDLPKVRRTIDVTMWGAFHVLRAAARQMIAQKNGGCIVCVSSPHAFVPIAGSMAYNMAKAALDQMARTAALELAQHRIRVNLVHPGWTDTPGEREFLNEDQLTREGQKLLWGRLAKPEEIARGISFLCDPKSDYITGSSLLIDGGYTLPWWCQRGE